MSLQHPPFHKKQSQRHVLNLNAYMASIFLPYDSCKVPISEKVINYFQGKHRAAYTPGNCWTAEHLHSIISWKFVSKFSPQAKRPLERNLPMPSVGEVGWFFLFLMKSHVEAHANLPLTVGVQIGLSRKSGLK